MPRITSDSGQCDIQERHQWNQLFAGRRIEGFVGRWTDCCIKPNPLVRARARQIVILNKAVRAMRFHDLLIRHAVRIVGPNARWRYQEIVSNSLLGRTLSARASPTLWLECIAPAGRPLPIDTL
jgi:hypothetical protein